MIAFFVTLAFSQEKPKEAEPPEEDETLLKQKAKKEYSFNPLQATKELQVGGYYMRKGAYKSAMLRFKEATNWNPGLPEAWLRLAEAQDKLKDDKAARDAYTKYLELAPDAKNADAIRKRLASKK
jgi:Tfp pilus assembly protein PilF